MRACVHSGVTNRVARSEEHDDFLVLVLLEECEQQQKAHVCGDDAVALLQPSDRRDCLRVVDTDVHGVVE